MPYMYSYINYLASYLCLIAMLGLLAGHAYTCIVQLILYFLP